MSSEQWLVVRFVFPPPTDHRPPTTKIMQDYTYPSIYLSYLFFFLASIGAVYFFVRSYKDGYWGEKGEEAKYRMLNDDEGDHSKPELKS